MSIPYIKFHEVNDSTSPISPNARNRILIAGEFSRGPANEVRFIANYKDFSDRYGSDNAIGSTAFQAAWDQGARDFALLRVLGAGSPAKGYIDFNGYASKSNDMVLAMRFIGDPVIRSLRKIPTSITTTGNYVGSVSGRYWFRVDEKDDKGYYNVKYVFVPIGIEGYINWYPQSRTDKNWSVDPTFPFSTIGAALIQETSNLSSISSSLLQLVGAEPIVFSNTCLDLVQPGMTCGQAQVNGWKVVIEVGDMRWIWHTDSAGATKLLDKNNSGYTGNIPVIVPGTNGVASFNTMDGVTLTSTQTGQDIPASGLFANSTTAGAINPYIIPVTESFIFHEEDTGAPISVDNGVFVRFDNASTQQSIQLMNGDMWTVRVNFDKFDIPIYDGATPSQVVTSIMEVTQGREPIGLVERNELDNGLIFGLDETFFNGSIGNNYSYYVELAEPDGEVITQASFYSGELYIQVPIRYGIYIKPGAVVSLVESGGIYGVVNVSNPFDPNANKPISRNILSPNTRVTKVDAPIYGGGLATIWLDKPVISDFDSIGLFHFANPNGLSISTYTSYMAKFMQGGQNGPTRASRDLYTMEGLPLVSLFAISEGAWGNNLRISLYPFDNKSFRLMIVDLNKNNFDPPLADEMFNVSFDRIDEQGGLIDLSTSKFIRGVFLPKYINRNFNVSLLRKSPMRLAAPDDTATDPSDFAHPEMFGPRVLSTITLEGGFDGPPPTDADYIRAIDLSKSSPVNMLVLPGIYSPVVKQRMIAAANGADEFEGLRIAILNAPPRLTPEAARVESIGYDSKRAVLLAGWSTYGGALNAQRYGLSPDAPYAGKLASIPIYVGPHARSSSGPVFGLAEVDTQPYTSKAQLEMYHDARMEVIMLDPISLSFNFLNGRTTSMLAAWEKVSFTRVVDMIRMDLARSLNQYKSEPNTPRLRQRIASSIDAYLGTLFRNGVIALSTTASVNANPQNPAGIQISFSVVPVYSADYIDVYISRADLGVS
jgi:hypothetical protein